MAEPGEVAGEGVGGLVGGKHAEHVFTAVPRCGKRCGQGEQGDDFSGEAPCRHPCKPCQRAIEAGMV